MSLKNWDNKTWLSSTSYIKSFNKFLIKETKLNKNSEILDIGCGRGKILGFLLFLILENLKKFIDQGKPENMYKEAGLDAKSIEENSNQILDFTKEVKNLPETDKIKIIESLWSIIYSNNEADIYETNLMRRLAGLLYIDSSTMGDIKDRIKKEKL